jgi:hypothetical protein
MTGGLRRMIVIPATISYSPITASWRRGAVGKRNSKLQDAFWHWWEFRRTNDVDNVYYCALNAALLVNKKEHLT